MFSLCCIAAGVLLLFYPRLRDRLGQYETASQARAYESRVAETKESGLQRMWKEAERYNRQLTRETAVLTDPFVPEQGEKESERYDSVLAVGEDGLMGFVEIPDIEVYLPIYHGTEAQTLEKGVGHLEGSSLPVGGAGTHAVLSGHTGLRSAKLFTDLDELEEGAVFFLHVLDRVLAYQVCDVKVTVPSDVSGLMIQPDRDLCTLVTCTPYGVNSHRLLVTGERIARAPEEREEGGRENEVNEMTERGGLLWRAGLILGLILILFPVFSDLRFRQQSGRLIAAQKQLLEEQTVQKDGACRELTELYGEAERYNASLVEESGGEIGDPESSRKLPGLIQETEERGLGYVEIPRMDVRLPLFFGTSDLHLARGAAILENTSVPLGETSSNTVIAGHRGYRGIPYFREIERLSEGDAVRVHTLWGSFLYRVTEIRIIDPSDTGALGIQPGKDMVTLLTCHPYLSGGKYRYVVFCERETADGEASEKEDERRRGGWTENVKNSESGRLILGEKLCRCFGIIGIVLLLWSGQRKRRKKRGKITGRRRVNET